MWSIVLYTLNYMYTMLYCTMYSYLSNELFNRFHLYGKYKVPHFLTEQPAHTHAHHQFHLVHISL